MKDKGKVLMQKFLDKCFSDLTACERKGDYYWLDPKKHRAFKGMVLKYKRPRRFKGKV